MPTIFAILTFSSMINKARNFFICQYFSFYEQLKFSAQLSWARKMFITSVPGVFFVGNYVPHKISTQLIFNINSVALIVITC